MLFRQNLSKNMNIKDISLTNSFEPIDMKGNLSEIERMLSKSEVRRMLSLFLVKEEIEHAIIIEVLSDINRVSFSQAMKLLRVSSLIVKTERTVISKKVSTPYCRIINKHISEKLLINIEKDKQFITDKARLLKRLQ